MKRKISFPVILILFLLVTSMVYPAEAQSAVERIIIKDMHADPENFPEILVKAAVLDSAGLPVANLPGEMLSVIENGNAVDFEISEIASGIRTVLILDLGKWINNQAVQTTGLVKERMQDLAIQYIDVMKDDDLLEIVVVYDHEAVVAQAFTNDKAQLRETIKKLNWNNENASFGLEGITRAIPDIADAPDDLAKRVLFVSPGIMTRDIFGKDEMTLTQELNANEIPFYSVHIPWSRGGNNYYSRFAYISDHTNGQFIDFHHDDQLASLFQAFTSNNTLYQITYRSGNGIDTTRTVNVSYLGSSEVSDSKVYIIDPSLIASAEIEILVNNGEALLLSSENRTLSAPVHIVVHGLGNRRIKNAIFQVNGEEYGKLSEIEGGTFTTTWSFPTEILSIGDTEVFLEVLVEDEFGVVHRASSAVSIRVSAPAEPLCRGLSQLPGIGTALSASCISSGFTLANLLNIVLFIALVAIGSILWFKRNTVVEVGREIGVRVTNVVDRLTNRLRKLEPKARLIAVQGIPSGSRQEFDLFGETPIGRSNESAELIFDNEKVSRLHCVIHEGHNGNWTIEDKDSANGTFVNGKKLEAFAESEIETGVMIELGPVEYGGIKFRFELIDTFSSNSDIFPASYEQREAAVLEELTATRATTNVRTRQTGEDTGTTPDDQLKPSDPANQKW